MHRVLLLFSRSIALQEATDSIRKPTRTIC